MDWVALGIGVVGALVVLWLILLVLLVVGSRDRVRFKEALRLLPDLLRLLARLARDPSVPRWLHVLVVVVLAYLASPIDLVPDVLPVVGYLDDVIIVVLILRWVISAAGVEAVDRNWPGTPEGRAAVLGLIGRPGAE